MFHTIIKIVSACFFLVPSLVLAQNYTEYLNKSYAQRQRSFIADFYHNPIFNDSAQFFQEVNKLKQLAIKHKDQELLIETELMFYNFYSSKNYPGYKSGMKKLIKKVDETKIKHFQARTRQALALHYFYEDMAYAKAIHYLEESYVYLAPLSDKKMPDKQELVYNIAFVHYNIGYYNTALHYLNIAQKLTNPYYLAITLNILNTEALIYKAQGNEKMMLETFQKLLQLSIEQKSEIWIRIAQNHLADFHRTKNNIAASFAVLNNYAFQIDSTKMESDVLLKRMHIRANNFIQLKEKEKALAEIKRIKNFINHHNDSNLHAASLPLFAYEAGQNNDFETAYQLMNQAIKNTTKVYQTRNIELVKQSDNKDTIEKYFRQQSELYTEKKINRIIIIGTLIIVVLLIIIAIALIQKQRSVFKQRQLKSALERQRMGAELEDAKTELHALTRSLLIKNKELDVFREELTKIEQSETSDAISMERATTLNNLLDKAILTDENWIAFKRAFENVHVDYIDRLMQKMPGLTQAELRYIVLRKLNLTGKEIAAILGISFDSVRTYKYRIRKKYSISEDDELEQMIHEI